MVKSAKQTGGQGRNLTKEQLNKLKEQKAGGYTSDLAGSGEFAGLKGTYPKIKGYKECCTPNVVTGAFDSISGILTQEGGARKKRVSKRRLKKRKASGKPMKRRRTKKRTMKKRKQRGGNAPVKSVYGCPSKGKFGCRQPTWDPKCF